MAGKIWTPGELKLAFTPQAAATLRAVVASGPPVQGLGQDRQTRRDTGNSQLVASDLDDALIAARRGRRLKLTVGRVFEALLGSEDADQFFGFVVVGREILVADGPIETFAVAAVRVLKSYGPMRSEIRP